jgi:hypothetical protein
MERSVPPAIPLLHLRPVGSADGPGMLSIRSSPTRDAWDTAAVRGQALNSDQVQPRSFTGMPKSRCQDL